MAFAELLDQVGGMGRFQGLNVALLCFPMLLMAAHNLLQNFTAAVPEHHCRVALNKACANGNATGNRDCQALLRVFVPQDGAWRPEKCWRFVTPQWQLLEFNSTGREPTEAEQEPCLDGWTYEGSVFTSTIVTEWDLVCNFRSLQQLAQSIYMAGVLVGGIIFGGLSDKSSKHPAVLKANLQTDNSSNNAKFPVADLVCTASLRRITVCLCFVWFSTSFAYYGLAMDLQNFGVSVYLIQVIFGAVDIPAKLVAFLVISYSGRRIAQALSLILAGLSIGGNIFVSHDMQILRTVFAVFGKGCLGASFNCVFLYTGELYPTVIRQTGMGFGNTMARVGGIVAPLVRMTGEYLPSLPLVIYATAPIISGMAACFLPETLNVPLPDTIEDVETRSVVIGTRWSLFVGNTEGEKRENGRKDQVCHPGAVLLDMTEIKETEKDPRLPENLRNTEGVKTEACSDIPKGAITISNAL
ncbi:solute carrier family 22 member 6-B-like [Notechis scutatus]|uniref:Solute carrier family 22 member 6-B-like n=1 Tax=Notechis scutatus TaxID=8663 RepID=A0A6J1VSD1_9SAUR|nr:solute carrier family 22 member 6-B-like [Notechis scutatus]